MKKLAFSLILVTAFSAAAFANAPDSDTGCWVWQMDDGNRSACVQEVGPGYSSLVSWDEYEEPGIWYVDNTNPYGPGTYFMPAGPDLDREDDL